MTTELLQVSVERRAGDVVVRPLGEVDTLTAPALSAALAAASAGTANVLLDLRGVDFMDVRGVAAIVEAAIDLGDRDGRLTVGDASATMVRMFEIFEGSSDPAVDVQR